MPCAVQRRRLDLPRFFSAAAIGLAVLVSTNAHGQVNPEIANCEEVRDEATQTQIGFCGAHIGCAMVLKLQQACTKAKGFLDKLKSALSGRDKITNDDVYEAHTPDLTPSETLTRHVSTARAAVRDAAGGPNQGSFSRKNVDRTADTYYEGGLKDGNMHGAGVYITSTGSMGRGQMDAGRLQGKAQVVNSSRAVFAGDFINSAPEGDVAIQLPSGDVFAGTRRDSKWSGVVDLTRRSGDHQKQLFDGAGKLLAAGPFAKAGQVAEIPAAPRASSADAVARGFNERIAAARQQCASTSAGCNKGCAGASVVGVLAVLAGKGAGAREATAMIEQCTARCDSAMSQCNDEVATMETAKVQAISAAMARDRAEDAARQAARSAAASPAAGPASPPAVSAPSRVPAGSAATAVASSGSGFVDVTLVNRWENRSEHKLLRVAVAAYDAAVARQAACRSADCWRNVHQYETGGLQNPFTLDRSPSNYVSPRCKYTPAEYSNPSVQQQAPEETCRQLLQQAIHQDLETSVTGIRTGAGLLGAWRSVPVIPGSATGDCSADLAALNTESRAIRARKPSLGLQASVVPDAQLGMYLAANKIRVLEASCKSRPEYAGVDDLRKSASELLQVCKALGGGTADSCVPRMPW